MIWQPIETAPKDEKLKILCRGTRVTCGNWAERKGRNTVSQWVSWDGGFKVKEPPTHWMPLPEPLNV